MLFFTDINRLMLFHGTIVKFWASFELAKLAKKSISNHKAAKSLNYTMNLSNVLLLILSSVAAVKADIFINDIVKVRWLQEISTR